MDFPLQSEQGELQEQMQGKSTILREFHASGRAAGASAGGRTGLPAVDDGGVPLPFTWKELGRRPDAGSAFGILDPSRHSAAFRTPRGILRHSGPNFRHFAAFLSDTSYLVQQYAYMYCVPVLILSRYQ